MFDSSLWIALVVDGRWRGVEEKGAGAGIANRGRKARRPQRPSLFRPMGGLGLRRGGDSRGPGAECRALLRCRPPASRRLYLNSVTRNSGLQARYVDVELHPNYNPTGGQDYDFAVLKTSTNMLVDEDGRGTGVEKIAMNRNPAIPQDDLPVVAVGYGQQSENDLDFSPTLMDVMLYYISNDGCARPYRSQPTKFNPQVMFCTGFPQGGKDACQGDSGGPLIDYQKKTLVGIISFGEGCAQEKYSGVNGRVEVAAHWIDDMICKLSSFPPSSCSESSPSSQSPNGETTIDLSPGQSPTYNPHSDAPPSVVLSETSVSNDATPFPGNGPKMAANAVSINFAYTANAQSVTWTLEQQDPSAKTLWKPLFQSTRGVNSRLVSKTFSGLSEGWYLFRLEDPLASSWGDFSLLWTSILGPYGRTVWGKNGGFSLPKYEVYFSINANGIPVLGGSP